MRKLVVVLLFFLAIPAFGMEQRCADQGELLIYQTAKNFDDMGEVDCAIYSYAALVGDENTEPRLRARAAYHMGMIYIALEESDFAQAKKCFEISQSLGHEPAQEELEDINDHLNYKLERGNFYLNNHNYNKAIAKFMFCWKNGHRQGVAQRMEKAYKALGDREAADRWRRYSYDCIDEKVSTRDFNNYQAQATVLMAIVGDLSDFNEVD